VLLSLLRLLLKPAFRSSSQRSLKTSFASMQDRLTVLAQNWGLDDMIPDWSFMTSDSKLVPESAAHLKFQFYRVSNDQSADGLVSIYIPPDQILAKSGFDLFSETMNQYFVPEEHAFQIFHQIRIAKNILDFEKRKNLLIMRLTAITICCM
jgi:hypothetical protein